MSSFISIQTFSCPLGDLVIGVYEDKICLCDWKFRKHRSKIDARLKKHLRAEFKEQPHPVIDECIVQLKEYFSKKRKNFSLPLLMAGTEFQKTIWHLLMTIPYGATTSYLALSEHIQNKGAIRAVASSNGANAISILIPCHRVIGSDGSLTGYAGGLKAKRKLLELEGVKLAGEQFSLF